MVTSIPLGKWGRLLLCLCLFGVLRTLFFAPFDTGASTLSSIGEDQSRLERMLEKSGESGDSAENQEEEDGLFGKAEFIAQPFVLQLHPVAARPVHWAHYTCLLTNPDQRAVKPPPKG